MSVQSAFTKAGVSAPVAKREAPLAEAAMREFGITSVLASHYFLAQVLHESGRLNYFEEIASGAAYEGRKDLGNTHPGDGRRYKGRGPIQLTGRANYRAYGKLLGLDLEGHPELASQHKVGWRIAAAFWKQHNLSAVSDRGDFLAVTKAINGGTNGLADRVHYKQLISGIDTRPAVPKSIFTKSEQAIVKEFDKLKANKHKTTAQVNRQVTLKYQMVLRRKAIYAAGQKTGWNKANRRARYHAFLDRTK